MSLQSAQPLTIAIMRFGIAAAIMLVWAHILRAKKLPRGKQFSALAIYGLLNITIYLGMYVIAMQYLSAGIGALMVTSNPVLISFFSAVFFGKKIGWKVILALALCLFGVACASWPLLGGALLSIEGLIIGLFSMISYSFAAIYFARHDWGELDLITINGWQTLIGGLILLPFSLFFYEPARNDFDLSFWSGVLWLAIPVSIAAVNIWMWLLKVNEVRASFWLFLCPVFGYILAALIWNEPVYLLTVAGLILVILGLLISKRAAKIIE